MELVEGDGSAVGRRDRNAPAEERIGRAGGGPPGIGAGVRLAAKAAARLDAPVRVDDGGVGVGAWICTAAGAGVGTGVAGGVGDGLGAGEYCTGGPDREVGVGIDGPGVGDGVGAGMSRGVGAGADAKGGTGVGTYPSTGVGT